MGLKMSMQMGLIVSGPQGESRTGRVESRKVMVVGGRMIIRPYESRCLAIWISVVLPPRVLNRPFRALGMVGAVFLGLRGVPLHPCPYPQYSPLALP
jgi:hypothetical protein